MACSRIKLSFSEMNLSEFMMSNFVATHLRLEQRCRGTFLNCTNPHHHLKLATKEKLARISDDVLMMKFAGTRPRFPLSWLKF